MGRTGLGLAISRRLAERMNGKMRRESKPGEGSTLWCDLPFRVLQGCGLRVPPGSRLGKFGLDGVAVDSWLDYGLGPSAACKRGESTGGIGMGLAGDSSAINPTKVDRAP
ncbi:MAG: ATP-binding protein [Acidobacteria bacterium]|nr:ATP-binding protein [Acidobacteriota bacterium]